MSFNRFRDILAHLTNTLISHLMGTDQMRIQLLVKTKSCRSQHI